MTPVAVFCEREGVRAEWIFVLEVLIVQRQFCPPDEVADSVFRQQPGSRSQQPDNYIYWGAEEVVVAPQSLNDWRSVVDEMVVKGFVVIAEKEDVAAIVQRYLHEPSANTRLLEPHVGDVLVTEIGYRFWTDFLGAHDTDGTTRRRFSVDRNNRYLYVAPTKEELQTLCPFLGFDDETEERLHSLCSRFAENEDYKHCQIEHIGPYWHDNYLRYPDGYAIRCSRKPEEGDYPYHEIFLFSDFA